VKVTETLRDTSKRVATQWLFNSMSYMLGFVESGRADDPDAVKAVVESQSKELDKVETYYKNSAGRSGQIIYLGGTLLGLVPLIVIAVVAVLFRAFGTSDVATAAACFSAGGVGALVSVMARMNSARVGLDWEFGKDTLRTLGSLRPFIGAVFGLMTYFALKSGVITLSFGKQTSNNFSFYVLFAFAAGFSERLARDMLLGSTIDRVLGKEKSQPSPGPEHGAEEPVAAPESDGAPADLRPAS
jgi:hypothetical protein